MLGSVVLGTEAPEKIFFSCIQLALASCGAVKETVLERKKERRKGRKRKKAGERVRE